MKGIRDWILPVMQTAILVVSLVIPFIFDVASKIQMLFVSTPVNFDTAQYYYLMKMGNGVIGIAFMLFITLPVLRRCNYKKLLNTGELYHDHCYAGYWFCSKVLGYNKCSLVRVPIAMQFKLVIRDTFAEYDYGQDNDYRDIDNEDIEITCPSTGYTSTVNLVLADTYPVTQSMLPACTSSLSTIWIQRDNKKDSVRCFSKKFHESVQNTVRQLPNNVCGINLYPTLNPKHSYWIARNVFKMGGRSNIGTLKIYSQSNKNGSWDYSEIGTDIFIEK